MTISHRATKLAVCAIVGALGLAACSKSSTTSGSVSSTGAFGSVPAASGTAHAGTITWAEAPGSAPTWILPIVPSADATTGTINDFVWEMWRPLYWYTNGVDPIETPDALRMLLRNILFFADDPDLVKMVFRSACEFLARVPAFRLTFFPDARVWDLIQ